MDGNILRLELNYLNEMLPAFIKGVFSYGRNDISFLLKNSIFRGYLSINLESSLPGIFLNRSPSSKVNENSNIARLHRILTGSTMEDISIITGERYFYINLRKERDIRLFVSLIPQKLNAVLLDKDSRIIWANTYKAIDKNSILILEGVTFSESDFLKKKFKEEPKTGKSIFPSWYRKILNSDQLSVLSDFYSNESAFDSVFSLYLSPFDPASEIKTLILPFRLQGLEPMAEGDLNTVLEERQRLFYHYSNAKKIFSQSISSLYKELNRQKNKLSAMNREFKEANEHEKLTLYGEIIKANLGTIKGNSNRAFLKGFDGMDYDIPLDVKLSPKENMHRYFKLAKRMKRGIDIKKKNIENTLKEMEILQQNINQHEAVRTYPDLDRFLYNQCPAPDNTVKSGKPAKNRYTGIREYTTPEGYTILVAGSSKANDELTFKIAKPGDTWLHTQNIPGSHVIIKNQGKKKSIPLEVLLRAAELAVKNSKARNSSKVSVDYTLKKYVKKPKKSAPGFVIYTNQKTLIIDL